ncbi:MAG: hypothetical protein HZC40_07845 [Chloroflexi bacterium]|nr:hypothetical protein [Chloroflexota bacterium]
MRSNPARRNMILAALAFVAILIAIGVLSNWAEQNAAIRQLVYTIPPGTSARLRAGEQVNVLPAIIRIALDVHDTLIIRNQDTEPVTIGALRLEPGQQFRQKYFQPGSFTLICSTHTAGELQIIVEHK